MDDFPDAFKELERAAVEQMSAVRHQKDVGRMRTRIGHWILSLGWWVAGTQVLPRSVDQRVSKAEQAALRASLKMSEIKDLTKNITADHRAMKSAIKDMDVRLSKLDAADFPKPGWRSRFPLSPAPKPKSKG